MANYIFTSKESVTQSCGLEKHTSTALKKTAINTN